MVLGLISGAMGPFTNAPIDTIKTRIQKATRLEGETAWTRLKVVATDMFRQEGPRAFYKGITPRVARVAPGQAVVFTVRVACNYENLAHSLLLQVYEKIKFWSEDSCCFSLYSLMCPCSRVDEERERIRGRSLSSQALTRKAALGIVQASRLVCIV